MPLDLKNSITTEINKSIITKYKILLEIFSSSTLTKMIDIIEDVQYVNNDEIPL